MTIELAKRQAEKASGFMVNAERVEHQTYTHTILVENNNQEPTENGLALESRRYIYQHNHLSISTIQTTMWIQEGSRCGRHVLPQNFFRALEAGAMFCNSRLNRQLPTRDDPNQENGKYCLQAMHLTFIARRRYSSSVQCL